MKLKGEIYTTGDLRRLAKRRAKLMQIAARRYHPDDRVRFKRYAAIEIRLLHWAAKRIDDHDRGMAFAHSDHRRRGGTV